MYPQTACASRPARTRFSRKPFALLIILLLALAFSGVHAQQQPGARPARRKLPAPDKIVSEYLKAIGGKKRVAAIRDATYEWKIEEQCLLTMRLGSATTQLKAPASTRTELNYRLEKVKEETAPVSETADAKSTLVRMGANLRSAWLHDGGNSPQTLTDAEAHAAKLQSILEAGQLVDYKKQNVLARTVGVEDDPSADEPAYVVEFSLRSGARLRYLFGVKSRLLLGIQDEARHLSRSLMDYRAQNGVLVPHRVTWQNERDSVLTLHLQAARYNTGLADALFDPPGAEAIDIEALLREVDRNQERLEESVGDYTYTKKRTERKINERGEVTKETVRVFEVYPLPNRQPVEKLISENGVTLPAEKLAKEEKRVVEELEKAERERARAAEKLERERQQGKPKADDEPGIADFLRAAELVSPRRESLRGREAIVFDFRPRAGYKPKGDVESIVSKLTGIVWIDPFDKQVMRLEARLVESIKMGGGLVANVRPGTAFIYEQKRMEDGVWLPVFSQVNLSAKVFLFKGIELNVSQEFSNYQKFKSSFDEYNLASPEEKQQPPAKP